MVGCGHGEEHGHAHPDSWCFNLAKDLSFFAKTKTPEDFEKSVQHDEVLDIRTFHIPVRDKNTREFLPLRDNPSLASSLTSKSIIGYKNKVDVILLERPLPETLNKPWTLWNAVHKLKVGGELIIDSCQGYRSDLYSLKEDDKYTLKAIHEANGDEIRRKKLMGMSFYLSACCTDDLTARDYNNSLKSEKHSEKIKRFSIQFNRAQDSFDMVPMADYLALWFLNDIINVQAANQPYAGRETRILSAAKTQETENAMEDWARAIQSYKYHIMYNK